MKSFRLAAALLAGMAAPALADGHAAMGTYSADVIGESGDAIGTIGLTQGHDGVLLDIDVRGLPPGFHGIHIHSVGDCSDIGEFKHSRGHVNPEGEPHGLLHAQGPHAGDLPNLYVHDDGTAVAQLYTNLIDWSADDSDDGAIFDGDGSAIIIHAGADDHKTQPIGGAGGRIACAVLSM